MSTDVSRVYQFLAKQGDWKAVADANGDGTVIKSEFRTFMEDNFEWDGEDASAQNDLINNFWKTIDTKQSGNLKGTNLKNKNALDSSEMAAMDKKIAYYEVLNDFTADLSAPSVVSDSANWKKSVTAGLSALVEKYKGSEEELLAYLEEQSPIIEAKATADYCANDYLNTEMSTLVKDYGYAYADDATLQGIIDSYIQNIPEEILETLVNLKNVSQPIKIIDTLLPEHIITPRLEILMENLHHFNIKIKTRQNAQAEILGYLIIDLNNNKHAIVRFDTENKIQEMRFEHIDAGKINVLLKLTCPEIETCNLKDFSEILY